MTIGEIAKLITEISVISGVVVAFGSVAVKLINAAKCQLRNTMLTIYYDNCEKDTIRQYEYENFMMLYKAYKALKGNSFIDKIHKEVEGWEIDAHETHQHDGK